jgi:hypothetical protein
MNSQIVGGSYVLKKKKQHFNYHYINNIFKLTVKKISDFFHIDFHIRDLHGELNIARCIVDTCENLFNNTRDDTLCFFVIDVRTLVSAKKISIQRNQEKP